MSNFNEVMEANKKRIYEIVEAAHGSKDTASQAYDFMIYAAVIVGLLPLMMKTDNFYTKAIDILTTWTFLVDYILRVYTADYKMGIKYYKAYVYYAFSPMAIIDLLSIVPIVGFFFPGLSVFGIFRIFRIFRLFKLIRYSKTMVTITNVVRRVKNELLAVLVLTVIYIMASAMILFQLEPGIFDTFFDALYWSTISITTVGYGDISPVTDIGRFMTMVSSLVGVAIIALPSGIITAGYMDEIHRKKGKHEL